MGHYRDDLDAARARIETLEAKVKEREAALGVREAELSEMRCEIARLQRGGEARPALGAGDGPTAGQRAVLVALAMCGLAMSAGYAFLQPSYCHAPLEVRAPRPFPVSLPVHLPQVGAEIQAPTAGGAAFDQTAATKALGDAAELARNCEQDGEGRRSIRVRVVFAPSGGVSSATVIGELRGPTAMSQCVSETFKSVARVPAFDGSPVSVVKSVRMD